MSEKKKITHLGVDLSVRTLVNLERHANIC
jgi:hypothetical protein